MTHADKVAARAEILMDICGLNYSAALKRASLEIRREETLPVIVYTMSDIFRITDAANVSRVSVWGKIAVESRNRFYLSDCKQGIRKTFKANQHAAIVETDLTFSDWKRVVTWTRLECESQGVPFPHMAGDAGAWSKPNG